MPKQDTSSTPHETSHVKISISQGAIPESPKQYVAVEKGSIEGGKIKISGAGLSKEDRQITSLIKKTHDSIANISEIISVLSKGFNASISGKLISVEDGKSTKPVMEFTVRDGWQAEAIAKNFKDFFKHDSLSAGYLSPIIELPQKTPNNRNFYIDVAKFPELNPAQLIIMAKRAEEFPSFKFNDQMGGFSRKHEEAKAQAKDMLKNSPDFPIKLKGGNDWRSH